MTKNLVEPREARGATGEKSAKVKASPAVRKLAKEHGIELADITPTGKGGKLTKQDVLDAYHAKTAPPVVEQPKIVEKVAQAPVKVVKRKNILIDTLVDFEVK